VYDANAIKIYTDGSATPNPGCGGIGMVVEYPDSMNLENVELSEGYKLSTNNRMELLAVISAMRWLQTEMRKRKFTRALIITDSEYVYSNHSNVQYWKTDGWKNKEGKPYENQDLWDFFLKERQKTKLSLELKWEKGKLRPVLKLVDTLAKRGAKSPTGIDYGYRGGKFTATRSKSKKAATLFLAQGQEAVIRIYRKNIYGKGSKQVFKITFDLYDKVTKSYKEKHFAYYNGGNDPDLKRNNCYRAIFNESKTFPQILAAKRINYIKGN
jgi:ribonuclease HI